MKIYLIRFTLVSILSLLLLLLSITVHEYWNFRNSFHCFHDININLTTKNEVTTKLGIPATVVDKPETINGIVFTPIYFTKNDNLTSSTTVKKPLSEYASYIYSNDNQVYEITFKTDSTIDYVIQHFENNGNYIECGEIAGLFSGDTIAEVLKLGTPTKIEPKIKYKEIAFSDLGATYVLLDDRVRYINIKNVNIKETVLINHFIHQYFSL